MGHYSDYYDAMYEEQRVAKKKKYTQALKDLIDYSQYNAPGKTENWTFSEIGLEDKFEALVNKLKAKLYDLGDTECA